MIMLTPLAKPHAACYAFKPITTKTESRPPGRGRLSFLLGAVLLLGACAPVVTDAPRVAVAVPTSSVSYHPLDVGLSWTYQSDGARVDGPAVTRVNTGLTSLAGQTLFTRAAKRFGLQRHFILRRDRRRGVFSARRPRSARAGVRPALESSCRCSWRSARAGRATRP